MNEDKSNALRSLKISKGQIEGIIKMIEEERYCMDISNQIIAAQALLKKANVSIIKQHINHCVKNAVKEQGGEDKIDEIIELVSKLIDK